MSEGLSEGTQQNETVEQPVEFDAKAMQEELVKLQATNERLLSESKANAQKYREIRDKSEAKAKLELEENENWKGLLDVEKNKSHELEEKYKNLKKESLTKDLNFTVAKLIDRDLQDGASVDDVIHHVLETGMVEVNEDDSGFLNVSEAYNKVAESKAFLFKSKKVPMANAVPDSQAPREKKISKEELFRKAVSQIHK